MSLLVGVADGLAVAHQSGILHRDLKPENVLVDGSGYGKLADFGLAKRLESSETRAADASNTVSMFTPRALSAPDPLTLHGTIVGTVPYMSPEQTMGGTIDHRGDIFLFGILLHEALSGTRPFDGTSNTEIMTAIRDRSPPSLPDRVPPQLRWVVDKALEKDPGERYQTMQDLVVDLRHLLRLKQEHLVPDRAPAASPSRVPRVFAVVAVGLLLALVLVWMSRPKPAPWNPLHNARITGLTDFPGDEFDADVSPDGELVVFISDHGGRFDAWLAPTGGRGEPRNLTRDFDWEANGAGGVRVAGFSGDGSEVWLHFHVPPAEAIRILAVPTALPGRPRRLFEDDVGAEIAWARDGRWVYHAPAPGDPLYISDDGGRNPRLLHKADDGVHQHYLRWSPDGKWIYMSRGHPRTGEMNLWRIRSDNGDFREQLTEGSREVAYPAPIDERTVFFVGRDSDGAGPWLYACDLETGTSQRVLFGLERFLSVAASEDGRRLVATRANPTARLWKVPILADKEASEKDAEQLALPTLRALGPQFGGESLFFLSSRGPRDGLWRRTGDDRVSVILPGTEHSLLGLAAVSRDGRLVAVCEQRGERHSLMILGAEGTQRRTPCEEIDALSAGSWSPDAKFVVVAGKSSVGRGLFKIDVENGSYEPLVEGAAFNPVWSPKGDLIVYSGPQAGPFMSLLAVTTSGEPKKLPGQLERLRVGERYRFLPDGSGLVLMKKTLTNPSGEFWMLDLESGKTSRLTRLLGNDEMRSFDITPDGKFIVFDRLSKGADIVLIELDATKD